MLLPGAAENTADTLSFAVLIIDGRTHFDRGPFKLGRSDSCLKNFYKLVCTSVLVDAFAYSPRINNSGEVLFISGIMACDEMSYMMQLANYFCEKSFWITVVIAFVPESL